MVKITVKLREEEIRGTLFVFRQQNGKTKNPEVHGSKHFPNLYIYT